MLDSAYPNALLARHSPFARLKLNSHQQCLLLLETLFDKMLSGYQSYQQQRFGEFGFHLGRCSALLDHLHQRLDFAGPSGLAEHFSKIYQHAESQLQLAAMETDIEPLTEAERVLRIAYECARDLLNLAQPEQAARNRLQ